MTKSVDKRQAFLNAVIEQFGERETITRQEIIEVCNEYDLSRPVWLTKNPDFRAGRGRYTLPKLDGVSAVKAVKKTRGNKVAPLKNIVPVTNSVINMAPTAVGTAPVEETSLVPSKIKGYVPFGHYNDVRTIIASRKFYPLFITGLSGNGKTMMVEQTCAAEKRELIRVNITIETDEDDLIGGFRLHDGHTVWQNGPVISAMERGAVLLLDEVDLGSNKLMCLQPILEGSSVFLKKINKLVKPAPGFQIIATANTKGKGSDDGRFIGTNVMNEAFLERFSVTLEQEYPNEKMESKILRNIFSKHGIEENEFVDKLVRWGGTVRKSFEEDSCPEIISTRRLVHICEAFVIFKDREKAINLCINRFDHETKNSFWELYKKLDETIDPVVEAAAVVPEKEKEYPF
jgi:hypothetical protein